MDRINPDERRRDDTCPQEDGRQRNPKTVEEEKERKSSAEEERKSCEGDERKHSAGKEPLKIVLERSFINSQKNSRSDSEYWTSIDQTAETDTPKTCFTVNKWTVLISKNSLLL